MLPISSNSAWRKFLVLFCTFTMFISIRPSEPYLTIYLMGPYQNLSESQLLHTVYPTWTYSYLALLVPLFIITDLTRYKPVVVAYSASYVICYVTLVFGKGIELMKLMQVVYALATACEVGFYSYPYNVLDKKYFQKVTSYVRSTCLIGQFIGSVVGQVLVLFLGVDVVLYLHVATLASTSLALFLSFFLPMPIKKVLSNEHLNKKVENTDLKSFITSEVDEDAKTDNSTKRSPCSIIFEKVQKNSTFFVESYRNTLILKWSFITIFTMCGWLLVVGYVQNLWQTFNKESIYNGFVESVATVLGALSTFIVSLIPSNWINPVFEYFCVFLSFLLMTIFLYLMTSTTSILVCYTCYALFISVYSFISTFGQFRLASVLNSQKYALIFGFNTFVSVLLNTLAIVILLDEKGFFNIEVRTLFYTITVYCLVLLIICVLSGLFYKLCKNSSQINC